MPPFRLHVQILVVARTTDPNLGSPSEQRGIPQPLLLPLRRRRQRQSTISTCLYDSRLIFPTANLLSRTAADLFTSTYDMWKEHSAARRLPVCPIARHRRNLVGNNNKRNPGLRPNPPQEFVRHLGGKFAPRPFEVIISGKFEHHL